MIILLSDVEARAERRRTRTRADVVQDLVQHAWTLAHAATEPAEARRWLERAHRLVPSDGTVALALATARLNDHAPEQALPLFDQLAKTWALAEAWAGSAMCNHLLGRPDRANAALEAALRSSVVSTGLQALGDALAPAGWCGMAGPGVLQTGPKRPVSVRIDGVRVELRWSKLRAKLPGAWWSASRVEVDGAQGPFLGSPLGMNAFTRTEGFVEAQAGGVSGWIWHPADPARRPALTVDGSTGRVSPRWQPSAEPVPGFPPLAQPRRFVLSAAEIASIGAPLAVRGPDGRHLWGSPLDPALQSAIAPVWADTVQPRPCRSSMRPPVDVVVPAYRGLAETLACIHSVLASVTDETRVIVVDDASPEPDLAAALGSLAGQGRIHLIRHIENRGFPAAANTGIRAAATRDVVLLNSDTLVPPGWLERLGAAAYSAPDVGTATPFTNDGTILSVPNAQGGNPVHDLAGTVAADALAQRASRALAIDIPVGVGFCLYLRRDCLDDIGLLREDLFAQGYGEENDFCLRARHRGWRNVAALRVFVAHVGAASFGAARAHLVRRNAAILERLHPGYEAMIAAHLLDDPLAEPRRAMDRLRWAEGQRPDGAVIIITHDNGGGVEQVVAARAHAISNAGQRPIILRPLTLAQGSAIRVEQPGGPAFPNLVFPAPRALETLVQMLRGDKPLRVELHHMLGHHESVVGLAARLGVEMVSVVHDYARFCPRIALVGASRRYCGEPDTEGCIACIDDLGSLLEDDPPVPDLLARSTQELASASRVVAPSRDAATRLRRHFPDVMPEIEPWEDDRALPPLEQPGAAATQRVVVVGAIGVEKGFEVLLGCARDARSRVLPLEFVVVGFTADDARLLRAGPVFITGEYKDEEAIALIKQQQANLAFIPSVWPETWCFALSRAWQAGLAAAVFDLGAQAERVRRTGRGWVLPLGLAPPALNDALLRLATAPSASHSRPHFSPSLPRET